MVSFYWVGGGGGGRHVFFLLVFKLSQISISANVTEGIRGSHHKSFNKNRHCVYSIPQNRISFQRKFGGRVVFLVEPERPRKSLDQYIRIPRRSWDE